MLAFVLSLSTSRDMCRQFQTKLIGEANGKLSVLCSSMWHTFTG